MGTESRNRLDDCGSHMTPSRSPPPSVYADLDTLHEGVDEGVDEGADSEEEPTTPPLRIYPPHRTAPQLLVPPQVYLPHPLLPHHN